MVDDRPIGSWRAYFTRQLGEAWGSLGGEPLAAIPLKIDRRHPGAYRSVLPQLLRQGGAGEDIAQRLIAAIAPNLVYNVTLGPGDCLDLAVVPTQWAIWWTQLPGAIPNIPGKPPPGPDLPNLIFAAEYGLHRCRCRGQSLVAGNIAAGRAPGAIPTPLWPLLHRSQYLTDDWDRPQLLAPWLDALTAWENQVAIWGDPYLSHWVLDTAIPLLTLWLEQWGGDGGRSF